MATKTALACVHCAKSKARCDRKVPCTRCERKKLCCQSRVSQRGVARPASMPIASTNQPSHPDSSSSSNSTESSNGVWMNWSRRFEVMQPVSRPEDVAQKKTAQPDAFLSQLVATGTEDEAYPFLDLDLMDFDMSGDYATEPRPEPEPEPEPEPGAPSPPKRRPSVPIDALDGWSLFRCNPIAPSSACQSTRACNVKRLYVLLKDERAATGNSIGLSLPSSSSSSSPIEPLLASTRDKVTAVLQGLFCEAQHLYGLRGQDHPQDPWLGPSLLTLPPPAEMERLLRTYADCCEPHYPVVPLAAAGTNRAIQASQATSPSMALLLMAAVGALAAAEPCREIARGIVDICRTALGRLVEQNVQLAADPDVGQCAWLLTMATVWSGDKRQMDIGSYQKAMYLEMHLRAGRYYLQEKMLAQLNSSTDVAQNWELWKCQERLNRATYSWLILDCEICLFQDTSATSFLSVASLDVPIPSPDAVLTAPSAQRREQDTSSAGRVTITMSPPLRECVDCFTDSNDDLGCLTPVSPTTLRLLLCSLIDQVLHLRSRIDSLSARSQNHKSASRHTSAVLLPLQVNEAQELLQRWFDLTQAWCPSGSAANSANRIIYHLVVLNTMASLPTIEKMARTGSQITGQPSSVPRPSFSPRRPGRAYHLDPEDVREIFVHCGQVLRNIRLIPEHARPPWWAGAVYRVALTAWANSLAAADIVTTSSLPPLSLDSLPASDTSIAAYLGHQHCGPPVFSDAASGTTVSLADPPGILLHCARLLDSDVKSQLTHGIQQKLTAMVRRWEGRVS